MSAEKTIAAVSTPHASGGIGIVRISGGRSLAVADKIFRTTSGKLPSRSKGYRAYHGRVWDNEEVVDEAVCLVFRAPKSYTGEDVAEISCHGGLYVTQRVLRAALNAGAEPAEAGEFTKRAFLNGRIGLEQAEAVMSLIAAQSDTAAKAALNALDGALSEKIRETASSLIAACAQLAAWVDYPDEDIEEIRPENLKEVFARAKAELTSLLDGFEAGRAATEGVNTVIVGRPNVGKSTLMNLLSGYERSIVTECAGTTRDVVEETVRLGGIVLRLADTAGIRETDNPVESIGVGLAKKKLELAGLILAVFDGSDPLTDDDRRLLESCRGKTVVGVVNKSDLPRSIDLDYIKNMTSRTVEISASEGEGLETLVECVEHLLGTDRFDPGAAMLANERQRQCCERASRRLDEALEAIDTGLTLDAVNVCADAAIDALLELTGEKAGEAVVNEVFSRFCVGK